MRWSERETKRGGRAEAEEREKETERDAGLPYY